MPNGLRITNIINKSLQILRWEGEGLKLFFIEYYVRIIWLEFENMYNIGR